MVEVILRNVCKYFSEVKAVDNLNMKVNDKEFIVLLGPLAVEKQLYYDLLRA